MLSQNQMSEFKVTLKMKVVQLHDCKNYPKIKSKSNVVIEGNIENVSATSGVDPKTVFEP